MSQENLRFAKTHEWVFVNGQDGSATATVGVSAFAVEALTDLVYIELPEVGRQLAAGESFGEIESVKAVSDLYAPVSGEVIDVNRDLANHLEWLSEDPYGRGWMIKLRLAHPNEADTLLDRDAYDRQCAAEQH